MIPYIWSKSEKSISQKEKNKIILPFHNDKLDFIDNDNSKLISLNLFKQTSMTKRQLECAKLLLSGKKTSEIAASLKLSPRTVEHYLNHLKSKLNCKNKTELIIKLTKTGL